MPKTSHGPEPKAGPTSLVVMLRGLRGSVTFRTLGADLGYTDAIKRAEVLEERLVDLHDAVEKAIGHLNERDGQFKYEGKGEHLVEEALATLNKVL